MKNSIDVKQYDEFRCKIDTTSYEREVTDWELIEVHAITCTKCGAPLELKYGEGKCSHCGTCFTSKFTLEEAHN